MLIENRKNKKNHHAFSDYGIKKFKDKNNYTKEINCFEEPLLDRFAQYASQYRLQEKEKLRKYNRYAHIKKLYSYDG
jgi:hypothetical protein